MAKHRSKRSRPSPGGVLQQLLKENGLTLALGALFLICLAGQSLTGLVDYNNGHHAGGHASYAHFLVTGAFLEGVFSNWQAAILQLGCLIVFGAFLYQKGATHSKSPRKSGGKHSPARSIGQWVARNSLSVVFAAVFLACFVAHAFAALAKYNSETSQGHPSTDIAHFVMSAKFWFLNFQTWQAEFFAIALFTVLSIFLRQQGSPESKPLSVSDGTTGKGE